MKTRLTDKKRNLLLACCSLVFIVGFTGSDKSDALTNTNHATDMDINSMSLVFPDFGNPTSSLSFIHDSLCFIKDPANSMTDFIKELHGLLNGKDTVINVIHLGDSHIQAGFLSGQTMRLLQNSFGNAGRGWIAPFKLSKVNEPNDYYITSNIKDWIAGRCVQIKPKCPYGIGGIGIQTQAKDIDFRLIMTPTNGAGYSFNKVLLYRDCESMPMAPVDTDKAYPALAFHGNEAFEKIRVDTFTTASLIDTFSVRTIKMQQPAKANLYYGFMLMNGNPGILYHSIGVNGAKYTDYTCREYVRRLSLLNPSLIIISLGTNESFGRNFNKESFETQVHSFIRLVREEIPGTSIIISTPAEIYRRVVINKKSQYVRNENIAKIAEVITAYTEKEGIACWDLFSIAGGNNSCQNWFDAKMLGRDRIHFSQNGYKEQGALLFRAITRSCLLADAGSVGRFGEFGKIGGLDDIGEDEEIGEFGEIDKEVEIEDDEEEIEPNGGELETDSTYR